MYFNFLKYIIVGSKKNKKAPVENSLRQNEKNGFSFCCFSGTTGPKLKQFWKSVIHNNMNPLSKFKKKSVTYPRPRSDGSAWIDPKKNL
jgi:hypothetical protein